MRVINAALKASLALLPLLALEAQSGPTLILPGGALNQGTTPSATVTLTPNYSPTFIQFFATFGSVSSGYSIANGTYTGWCADAFADFSTTGQYNLISTYNTLALLNPPGGGRAQNPNWNMVNWVLNNKPTNGTANTWIVQQVIWKLLTGQYIAHSPDFQNYPAPAPAPFPLSAGDTAIANALYTAALAQGAFVPGPGQVAGVLLFLDGINPDGTSAASNYVVTQNNINPNGPPLNGLNGRTNGFQDILIEVPVGPGAIGDFVWRDTNQNGVQDAGEPGINGVTVNLCADSACSVVLATTTTGTFKGNDGYYQFTGLPLGSYWVSVNNNQPALSGLVPSYTGQGTAATDSNINPSMVTLTAGSPQDETIDFGFTSPETSAIGDFVWQDDNANGLQDGNEPGLPGLTVKLCADAACNTVLATTTTDQNGAYHFTGLFAGTYYVQVTPGAGFVATTAQAGFPGNGATDSGGNVLGVPNEVVLGVGVTDNTIDFGFIPPAQGSIGDFIWHDLNRDGIQTPGEPGINNVTVRLYNSSSVLVATTTTVTHLGQDGYYQFTGLAAGSYTVVVDTATLPPGYTSTTPNAPGSNLANDSNGNSTATVTLATNISSDQTVDFGYLSPCAGVIGDYVWNDLNHDGIQDGNEPGLSGLTVNLYDASHVFILSTTTDTNGAYHFTGRCAGTYTVEVVPPANFLASPSTAAGSTPANDSNGSPATVTLGIDETNNTIDFGYYQVTGALITNVFNDLNQNTNKDGGENNLPGWTITTTGPSNYSNTGTTDANGNVSLTNLAPGTYHVCITPQATWTQTTPAGNCQDVQVMPNQTATDYFGEVQLGNLTTNVFNDLNKNTAKDAGEGNLPGWTITTTGPGSYSNTGTTDATGNVSLTNLVPGTYHVCITPQATWTQTTPAGTCQDVAVVANQTATDYFGEVQLGNLTTNVFNDLNQNGSKDGGEGNLSGWTITTTGPNNYSNTGTTDANGNVSLTNLAPGTYHVCITPQVTWTQTTPATACQDVIVAANQTTVDYFGEVQFGALTTNVFNDLNQNKTKDGGEGNLSGWTITTTGPNNYSNTGTTDVNGNVSLTNLAPGTYHVCITPKATWTQTTPATTCQDVIVVANQTTVDYFGEVQLGTLNAIVFIDANGTHNPAGQTGLTGWTVNITGPGGYTNTVLTGAGGNITPITGLAPGNYTVCAVPMSGYTQTTPAPLNNCQTVTVPAAGSSQAQLGYILIPPVTASCVVINAIQGTPITPVKVTASGGTGTGYTFVATGLPAGLTMSSDGTISGTSTASGTFPYTVTVTDSAGHTGTFNCSVAVSSLPGCGANLAPLSYNVSENGSSVAGEIVWFNSHLVKLGGTIPASTFQVFIQNGVIKFGTSTLTVPNAVITFSSTAACSSTTFDTTSGTWFTTIPLSQAANADEIFAAGLAYPLPSNFAQNVSNITWSATVYSSAPALQVSWQYGISNWLTSKNGTSFPMQGGSPDYNGMMINPAHNAGPSCSGYPSGDHAGAPEFSGRADVLTGGGSGGGASNWTGSWSSAPSKIGFVCQSTSLGTGDTATIGFWHNKNGQALINSFNGGPTSKALANWLATNFPHLYGASSANNLTGKTNADVASLFLTFFNVTGPKTYAQIMGGALAAYATNSTLSGTVAGQYGFNTSPIGTGSITYNVGSNGMAIGLTNNTSYTVLQLLQQADSVMPLDSSEFNALNSIFDGINSLGDIK